MGASESRILAEKNAVVADNLAGNNNAPMGGPLDGWFRDMYHNNIEASKITDVHGRDIVTGIELKQLRVVPDKEFQVNWRSMIPNPTPAYAHVTGLGTCVISYFRYVYSPDRKRRMTMYCVYKLYPLDPNRHTSNIVFYEIPEVTEDGTVLIVPLVSAIAEYYDKKEQDNVVVITMHGLKFKSTLETLRHVSDPKNEYGFETAIKAITKDHPSTFQHRMEFNVVSTPQFKYKDGFSDGDAFATSDSDESNITLDDNEIVRKTYEASMKQFNNIDGNEVKKKLEKIAREKAAKKKKATAVDPEPVSPSKLQKGTVAWHMAVKMGLDPSKIKITPEGDFESTEDEEESGEPELDHDDAEPVFVKSQIGFSMSSRSSSSSSSSSSESSDPIGCEMSSTSDLNNHFGLSAKEMFMSLHGTVNINESYIGNKLGKSHTLSFAY